MVPSQRSGLIALRYGGVLALGGAVLCLTLDLVLVLFARHGPPSGKGEGFFLSLAVILAGAVAGTATILVAGHVARRMLPYLFVLAAWHTGLQWPFGSDALFSVTVIDLLTVLAATVVCVSWARDEESAPEMSSLVPPAVAFATFCGLGVVIAAARGVAFAPFYVNAKDMALYPLIAVVVLRCIDTRRQWLGVIGLQIMLATERAVEGLTQGTSAITTTLLSNGQIVHRIDGHMASVNQYAFYLVSGLLLCLGALLTTHTAWVRIVMASAALLLVGALILTYSRGAWLGAACGVAVLLALLGARKGLGLAVLVAACLGAAGWLGETSLSTAAARITVADNASTERLGYNRLAIAVVEGYPFGAGWGANFAQSSAGVSAAPGYPWYHDDYLQIATEIGMLGLATFVWLWVTVLRRMLALWRRQSREMRTMRGALIAACVAMLVQAATDQFFWRPDIGPHIWIVAGLGLAACATADQGLHGTDLAGGGGEWRGRGFAGGQPVRRSSTVGSGSSGDGARA